MKKIRKKAVLLGMLTMLLLPAAACAQINDRLDVVGKGSVTSFETVLNVIPEQVEADAANGGWTLKAPDGTARFIWSKDWSKSPLHDVMLEFEARPFLDAGLKVDQLPEDILFYEDMLMAGRKLGDDELQYSGEATPLAAYEQIVSLKREALGYHTAMDHYGVDLGGGNLFEWAKDLGANDKDIVFVLNPEPFISAGVDPEKIEGWIFTKVTVDVDGKPAEVDKILKPYNLANQQG